METQGSAKTTVGKYASLNRPDESAYGYVSWALISIVIAVAIYYFLTALEFVTILIVVFLPVIALFLHRKPEIAILSIIVLTSSFIHEEQLPILNIGLGSLHISDLVLLGLLFKLFILRVPKFGMSITGPGLSLIGFLIVVVVLSWYSVAVLNTEYSTVIRLLRVVSYYSIYFLVTELIIEREQLATLVNGMYAISLAVVSVMVIQAAAGSSVQILPGRVEYAVTYNEYETLRLLPPGQTLLLYGLFISIASVIAGAAKIWKMPKLYGATALTIGIILTYNRSYWIAIACALLLGILLLSKYQVIRLVKTTIIAGMVLSTIALVGLLAGVGAETGRAIRERGESLLSGKALMDTGPVDDRVTENKYAIETIRSRPIVGAGVGRDYRPTIYGDDDALHNYIHNGYFFIVLNYGIFGGVMFILFYVLSIVKGVRGVFTTNDAWSKSVVMGGVLCSLSVAIAAFANPLFMQWFAIVIIATTTGVTEAASKMSGCSSDGTAFSK